MSSGRFFGNVGLLFLLILSATIGMASFEHPDSQVQLIHKINSWVEVLTVFVFLILNHQKGVSQFTQLIVRGFEKVIEEKRNK